MDSLEDRIDRIAAETEFSGAVRVDDGDDVLLAKAYGWADRTRRAPNTVATQFGIASGTKGLTALTVVRLIERGYLALETTARSLLGADLPMVGADVTVEQLLGHRSGIGDYLDEDVVRDVSAYVLSAPVHELATTESYLRVLDGHVPKFAPDQKFSYCNGGYVVLALLAERATGHSFYELVERNVCEPAALSDTAFLRSDELPGSAAVGYLDAHGLRSNVLHLPVRGSGDGGAYSTAADIHALWKALFAGHIVSPSWVEAMVRPRRDVPSEPRRYGLGFWLHPQTSAVMLVGSDAGVSFRSVHDHERRLTHTVLANTSGGAWPVTQHLDELLAMW